MSVRIFISCMSDEFRSYRDELITYLSRHDRDIKIQENLHQGVVKLLEKLDDYISACNGVIHLVGDGAGSVAKPAEVRAILERHPTLPEKLPDLAALLEPDSCPFTYTQWEIFLAIFHKVPRFIYRAGGASRRESGWHSNAIGISAQTAHFDRLRALGEDRGVRDFIDARDVAIGFLNAITSADPSAPALGPCVVWPDASVPEGYELADRADEFVLFHALITGRSKARIVLLRGPSDIGKSALIDSFGKIAQETGIASATVDCKSGIYLFETLRDLVDELAPLPMPNARRQIRQQAPEMLRQVVLDDMKDAGAPILLLFDTYERINEDAQRWVEERLLKLIASTDNIRVVIAGQKLPDPTKGKRWAEFVCLRDLPPILDPEHWADYSRRRGVSRIPPDHFRSLVQMAKGSPRLLGNFIESQVQSELPNSSA